MSKEKNDPDPEMINNEVREFRRQHATLILSTCSKEHQPLASYAPFIEDEEGHFYLLLSGLANHSSNLQHHEEQNNPVSVLLIEDEQQSRNLFARKRLTYSCDVSVWSREHAQWDTIIEMMQKKLGKTIDLLAGLGDFNLYCLTPGEGNYVRGFGQAYELAQDHLPEQVKK